MSNRRVLSDVRSVLDAKKVEETVKTGYVEPTVESITHWIAVEEDLASSYEALAAKPEYESGSAVLKELAKEAKQIGEALTELRRSLEGLDGAQQRRIEKLQKVASPD